MSMNISIKGIREIFVPTTNKKDTQYISFDCWQTPTSVSYNILNSDDPIEEYRQWVLRNSKPELEEKFYDYEIAVYYELTDPDLPNYKPKTSDMVYYEPFDLGYQHIQELNEWISDIESEGYMVILEVW